MLKQSKTILVTGAAGFIGARMVDRCHRHGHTLISVDDIHLFSTRPEHSEVVFGTKVDKEKLFEYLSPLEKQPDAIVHLGACSSTTEMNVDFLKQTNIEYSQKLWNHCSAHSIPFIYASSAATYGAGEQGYSDDESKISLLKPLNPYGDSKHIFDLWVLEQERKGNHPPIWSGHKFFNVFGFGERHKGPQASVVLHAFDQIQKTGTVKLFESHRPDIAHGQQKRDFIWVEDVLDVLEFALDQPLKRGIINLGSGQARSFLDLTRAVFQSLGKEEKIIFIPTPEGIRDRYQYFTEAEMSKLRNAGYQKPFHSLESAVQKTITALQAFERRLT